MNSLHRFLMSAALLAVLVIAGVSTPAGADTPGPHPHYVHALNDLRTAEYFLNRPDELNVVREQNAAIRDIRRAIAECERAAFYDAKNPWAPVGIDTTLDQRGRLRAAIELLSAAQNDLNAAEANWAAQGWRNVALRHVNGAVSHVRRAMRDKHWDDQMRNE